jgi:hypothetical protein
VRFGEPCIRITLWPGIEEAVDQRQRHLVVVDQPFDRARRLARERQRDRLVGLAARLLHHVGGEQLGRIHDALLALQARVGAGDQARRHGRGAERRGIALEHQHLGAGLARGQRRAQAAAPRTDDQHRDVGGKRASEGGRIAAEGGTGTAGMQPEYRPPRRPLNRPGSPVPPRETHGHGSVAGVDGRPRRARPDGLATTIPAHPEDRPMSAPQAPALSRATADFLARKHGHFIGGRWTPSASGETFRIFDPATGADIGECAAGDATEIDAAVRAARAAFEGPWSRFTAAQRGAVLWKIAELVQQNFHQLCELEILDNGLPTPLAQYVCGMFVPEFFRYYAGWPTKIEGATIPASPQGKLPGER